MRRVKIIYTRFSKERKCQENIKMISRYPFPVCTACFVKNYVREKVPFWSGLIPFSSVRDLW